MRIGPPPECQDIVDQIPAALCRPTDLIDMLCRLAPARNLRLNHFRIAKNGANDVVEVVRNPACERSDHLHAARPFQPHREFRSLALEKFALEIRGLQKTEIGEVEEPFAKGQKGSSAMPHKRNPIGCEQVVGLARLLRGNAQAALENVALWHERDISHSSVERVIFPDSCILVNTMLVTLRKLVDRLLVYPENMERNLRITKGLYFSQTILLKLTERGLERKNAYEAVQRAAMKTWRGEVSLQENLAAEPEIAAVLSRAEIDHLCSLDIHFAHVDETFRKLGLAT